MSTKQVETSMTLHGINQAQANHQNECLNLSGAALHRPKFEKSMSECPANHQNECLNRDGVALHPSKLKEHISECLENLQNECFNQYDVALHQPRIEKRLRIEVNAPLTMRMNI